MSQEITLDIQLHPFKSSHPRPQTSWSGNELSLLCPIQISAPPPPNPENSGFYKSPGFEMGCYAAIDNQNTKKEFMSMKDFNFGVRNCICMQITKPRKHCFKHIRAFFSLTEQGGTASQHCFGSSEPRPLQISVLPPLMQPGCLFWLQLPAWQALERQGWCLYWKSKTFLELPSGALCFYLIG